MLACSCSRTQSGKQSQTFGKESVETRGLEGKVGLIPCNLKDTVMYTFPIGERQMYVRLYNRKTGYWTELVPPEDGIEMYGYKDYKVVGNHLYLVYWTGACGSPSNVCILYCYDMGSKSWHLKIRCGEESEIIGNKFKAHLFKLVKMGSCSAEHEYEEYTQWVDLN